MKVKIIDINKKEKGTVDLPAQFNEIIKPTRRLGSVNLTFYLIIVVIILFLVKQFLLSINKIMW